LLEPVEPLPAFLPSAKLVLNETELLRLLKEQVLEMATGSEFGLVSKVFDISTAHVGRAPCPELRPPLDDEKRQVIEQCLGSEVTFVWGPPGTGKTHTIAALAAASAELGERLLVTSHTHAAVEQALGELIKEPDPLGRPGFLHGSPLLADGRVLKIGPLKQNSKLPPEVHLDSYLEKQAEESAQRRRDFLGEIGRLEARIEELQAVVRPWDAFLEAEAHRSAQADEYQSRGRQRDSAQTLLQTAEQALAVCRAEVAKQQRSLFIGRRKRVSEAELKLQRQEIERDQSRRALAEAEARLLRQKTVLNQAEGQVEEALGGIAGLPPRSAVVAELESLQNRAADLQSYLDTLESAPDRHAKELVARANGLFVTLTKLYKDRKLLADLRWDTVVIDESSMAMPPLVAYAAARATKRVIIAGDMYQLPPVVRGDSKLVKDYLATDLFQMDGITEAVDHGRHVPALAKLTEQRRMRREIASVAKELIQPYRILTNHPSTEPNARPGIPDVLGTDNPLVVVDTSSLEPWSGKVPGSLSRFNLVSAQVAVEIASLYAHQLPRPDEKDVTPVGIVTPYTAQRRLLSRLAAELDLTRWVTSGTVHTFQGSQSDAIIFDSVVGHPHFTARLTNPTDFDEVKKDLNVALTRARHQFIFVGDLAWLRKHAKLSSGYGRLLHALEERGAVLSASDLLGERLRSKLDERSDAPTGWDSARPRGSHLLTERDFYPSFVADLEQARHRVVLCTPFIGRTRWREIEPAVMSLRRRNVAVFLLHKPKKDRDCGSLGPRLERASVRQAGRCWSPFDSYRRSSCKDHRDRRRDCL
jgi:hypothetical protein